MHKPHIEVVEAKRWRNSRTGQLVSTGGSCPWHSDTEKAEWSLQVVGFTWYDRKANTTGLGRQPVATREEAQAIADTINSPREEVLQARHLLSGIAAAIAK